MALALFNPFLLKVVHRQSPSHGLTTPVDRLMRCHLLTLIVSRPFPPCGRAGLLTGCVYLHAYLVFKEPTAARQWRPARHSARSHRPGLAWKASPPVGRGTFRGTLRGYYRFLPLSTAKCTPEKTLAVEFEENARARNCCVNPGRFPTGERLTSIPYRPRYVKSAESQTADARPS